MDLVFVKSQNLKEEPYTTSRVISECGGQEHESVVRLINTYQKELKQFGKLASGQDEYSDLKSEKSRRGRPSKQYHLNEEQATFLITLMKNTKQVVEFKKDLVQEFFRMKKELMQRRTERETELMARKDLTDEIKKALGNDNSEYIKYTQMIYRVLFGKDASGLRQEYGIVDKVTPKDFMEAEKIIKVKKAEYMTLTMIELGYDYYKIKEVLTNKFMVH